jgi:hypothetical protein
LSDVLNTSLRLLVIHFRHFYIIIKTKSALTLVFVSIYFWDETSSSNAITGMNSDTTDTVRQITTPALQTNARIRGWGET